MKRSAYINTDIWKSPAFKDLEDDMKVFYFYLLIHPELTDLGTLTLERDDLNDPLDSSAECLQGEKLLERAVYAGLILLDGRVGFLWVRDFLFHQPVISLEMMRRWQKTQSKLPAGWLKNKVMVETTRIVKAYSNELYDALPPSFKEAWFKSEGEQTSTERVFTLSQKKSPQKTTIHQLKKETVDGTLSQS